MKPLTVDALSSNLTFMSSPVPCSACLTSRLIAFAFQLYRPFVVVLLTACSPSAILRRIRAIVVDPINRVFWRGLWSHVSKKVTKRLSPSVTHSNAPTTVVAIPFLIGVSASLYHGVPRSIQLCFATSASVSVFGDNLLKKTTTRLTHPRYKMRTSNGLFCPL